MNVELETTPTQTEENVIPEVEMFRKHYNIQKPEETPAEEVVAETPTEETKIVETPADPKNDPTEETPEISLLKELGFENVEALKEALNKQPEVQQSFFIPEDKEDEIAETLYMKKQLKALENETSEEKIIKAFIKLNNPEFDQNDVNAEYADTYTLSEDAEFDESKKNREEKKLRQKLKNDVATAKEFFAKKKEELKLPEYKQETTTDNTNDEEEKQLAMYRQKFVDGINGLKAVAPIKFAPKVKLDDKTEIEIPIMYELDDKGFNTIKQELLTDGGYDNLLTRRHYADNNYKADQIASDFYVLENLDKIIDSAVSQAVNNFRIDQLARAKNITDTTQQDKVLPQELQQDSKKEAMRNLFFKTP